MGLLNDAAAMARGRLAAIVFTAALPLVPACLVAGGIMRIAARFPAVVTTTVAAVALVAIGFAACILPGVVTALMVSVAAPVAVVEGRSGFSAVQRSWWLMKRAWPAQLGLLLSGAVPLLLLSQGLGRMLPDRALPHALLDAGLTVVLLPLPTFASVVLYLRQRASTAGKSVSALCQYILRISAPG